jgi:hypothetical protein
MPSSVAQSPFAYLKAEAIGQKSGQFWEQWELPKATKGSFLINLGNTAPLMLGSGQAVVIHDAGVFDTPESYSFAFRAWYRFLHKMLARSGAQLLTVSQFSRGRIAAGPFAGTPVHWWGAFADLPPGAPAITLCHELFDALPVHQLAYTLSRGGLGEWREILVDVAHPGAGAGANALLLDDLSIGAANNFTEAAWKMREGSQADIGRAFGAGDF